MREIKFRAVYKGTLLDRVFKPFDLYKELTTQNFDEGAFDPKGLLFEQFTGLRDKNGKEIYEGDILHWIAWGCPMDEFKELQETYKLIVKWVSGGFDIPYEDDTERTYEAIGNIHENPELLTVHA